MNTHPLLSHLDALMAPAPIKGPLTQPKTRLTREEKQRLQEDLWDAIDTQNLAGLKQCLGSGANFQARRNSISPLWAAIQAGRYDMAELLLEAGASILDRGPNSQSVWAAIAPRNDVEEGKRIKELAGGEVFGSAGEIFQHQAWDLLGWWLEQPGSKPIPVPYSRKNPEDGERFRDWLLAGLYGNARLATQINQAWGVEEKDPKSLVKQCGPALARTAWTEIARRDDVLLAQRALAQGWGPSLPEDFTQDDWRHKEIEHWWGMDMGWFLLSKRARRLWHWWTSVPAIKERFLRDGETHPQHTLWALVRDVPMLEHLHAHGVNLTATGPEGNTLLHHLAQTKHLSATMVQWWLKHLPKAYYIRNSQGLRPLDMPLGESTPGARAKAKHAFLETLAPKATKQAPERARF